MTWINANVERLANLKGLDLESDRTIKRARLTRRGEAF